MSGLGHFDWYDFMGIRFLLHRRSLFQERMEALNQRGLAVDLEQIEFTADSLVVEINTYAWGDEYWLMDFRQQDFDLGLCGNFSKVEGTRLAIYLQRSRLICHEGVPLKSRKLLKGAKPRRIWVMW